MEGRAVSHFDARLQQRLQDVMRSMEYPIPEERETEWRVALRTDLWKEDIDEIRPFRVAEQATSQEQSHTGCQPTDPPTTASELSEMAMSPYHLLSGDKDPLITLHV
ncbi:Hypothetical predicted protein [Pelobates cultripes]|uniref:Uncharacterized protein n=1 Tax=Pelobates cultripes TaxID=61616 RepID=A0AAD1SK74_PELCU|nr:Hypothetical predicted protein [Pelobates cultripes]